MAWKRREVESETQTVSGGGGANSEVAALREQLSRAQEAARRAAAEQEKLRDELQRRNDLLEKKDSAHQAQVRKMEVAEARIRELVHSEGEANYKSRALAGKMANLEKNQEEAESQRRALEKKLQNSQQQVNELSQQVQSAGGRLEQLRSVSEQRSQSAEGLEQQNRDLEAKLARAVGKLELYQGKVQSLQRQISDRETEMVLSQQKAEITTKERDVSRKELEESRKQSKTYRDSLTELEQSLLSQRRQLAEVEDSFERAKLALHRSERSRTETGEELANVRAELDTRQRELELEREEKASLLERVELLEHELVEESQALSEQLEGKRAELSALLEQLDSVDKSSTAERSSAQALRKEREALAADLEERTAQLRELKAFAERVKPAYENLKERYSELQVESRAQANELEDLRLKLSTHQSASSDLDSQHRELESRWKSMRAERDRLEAEKASLEAQIAEQSEARQRDQDALDEMGEENGRLTDELMEERSQHRKLRSELSLVQQTLASLEVKGAETTGQLLDIEEQARAARELGQELEVKLQAEVKRADEAERELDVRRRQLGKLVEDLKTSQAVSAKSQSNVKELLKQRTQLLEHKKQIEGMLSAGGEANAVAKQRLNLLDADKEALESALAELQAEHDEALLERDHRLRELEERLEEETALAAQRIEGLEQKLAHERAEHQQRVSELGDTLAAEIAVRQGREADLEADLLRETEQAELRLAELRETLELAIAERDDRVRELEHDYSMEAGEKERILLELQHQLGEALAEQAHATKEREQEQESFRQREAELRQSVAELQEIRRELLAVAEQAESDEAGLNQTVAQLEGDLSDLRAKQAALNEELAQEREQGGRLLDELAKRKAEGVGLHDETLDLQARIETLESELRARQEEAGYQIERRVGLEESLQLVEQRVKELEAQLDRSQREALGLREYIEKLQKVTKERIEQAKVALSAREQQIHRLREAVAVKGKQVSTVEAKLERTQLAENALRGALMDLRHMLLSREEMVEELEWHLSLVYATLEEGQADLETRDEELTGARERLRVLIFQLEEARGESADLSKALSGAEAERDRTAAELGTLRSSHEDTLSELDNERRQLAHALDKVERSSQRLERAQADLVEEHERSARLGAQLTDALEDRNRSVVRLRDLQQEFQDWRDARHDEDAAAGSPASSHLQDVESLQRSQARESALRTELELLRAELAKAHTESVAPPSTGDRERELEGQIEELRQALGAAEASSSDPLQATDFAELDEARQREATLQATVAEIREELARAQVRAQQEESARQESLVALQAALAERETALAEREAALTKLSSTSSQLTRSVTELESATNELEAATAERDELAGQLADLQLAVKSKENAPVDVSGFEEDLLKGFDLGSDLVSSQLEFLAAEERKNALVMQMEKAINLEALNALVEDLRDADQILADRQSEFELLETQWNEFHNELDDTSQLLLLKFTGLIEYEMREARQATEKSQSLTQDLEAAQVRFRAKYESLERQLEEKDLINGELEEELALLANQAAELGEQLAVAENEGGESAEEISWKETVELRRELREKSELLELYRRERQSGATTKTQETLEEQLELLTERYQRGRARIAELLEVIGERDRRLSALEKEVSGTSVFQGTLLSGSQLVRDLGIVDTHAPSGESDLKELGQELSRSRTILKEKAATFERLDLEQKAAQDQLADKRSQVAALGPAGPADQRERLQLEVDLLAAQLSQLEQQMGHLADDLEEEAEHRTVEDMPAVPAKVTELSDSHEL